jgi:hypothetical protein
MLFGSFLVDRGVVKAAHIAEAIDRQQRARPSLGQLAVGLGRVSREAVDEVLASLHPDQKLGEALVERGLLNETQLRQLLILQKRDSEPIGSILVKMGVLDEAALDRELIAFHEEKFFQELLH